MMSYFLQQSAFVLRFRHWHALLGAIRKAWYSFLGMKVGRGTILPRLHITWPNQLSIGFQCVLEHDIYFKFDGIWRADASIKIGNNVFIGSGCEFNINTGIDIGDNSLIASGCRFIDHNHGIALDSLMRTQQGLGKAIKLGNDVWLGCNVVVLKGVIIGDGAIVGAGSVVTKAIPSLEIWAGVPARRIGSRNQL